MTALTCVTRIGTYSSNIAKLLFLRVIFDICVTSFKKNRTTKIMIIPASCLIKDKTSRNLVEKLKLIYLRPKFEKYNKYLVFMYPLYNQQKYF